MIITGGMSQPVMVPFATFPSLGRSQAKLAPANIPRALMRDASHTGGTRLARAGRIEDKSDVWCIADIIFARCNVYSECLLRAL